MSNSTRVRKENLSEGMELISDNVNIDGSVGANSIIEASHLYINGDTATDSTQFARVAKINIHKGTLRCHNANISLLDGGEVHATVVNIDTCSNKGGYIYAQDVTISTVNSNLKIYASNSITINLVEGTNNSFKINYFDVPILNSKLELIDEDMSHLKLQLEDAQKHNHSKVEYLQKEVQTLLNEQLKIKESYKQAIISIDKTIQVQNEITFTIDSQHELSFQTQAQHYKPFKLSFENNQVSLLPTDKKIILD